MKCINRKMGSELTINPIQRFTDGLVRGTVLVVAGSTVVVLVEALLESEFGCQESVVDEGGGGIPGRLEPLGESFNLGRQPAELALVGRGPTDSVLVRQLAGQKAGKRRQGPSRVGVGSRIPNSPRGQRVEMG